MKMRVLQLGLGEVGQALAAELQPRVAGLAVSDLLLGSAGSAPARAAAQSGWQPPTQQPSAELFDLIISAVTADQAVAAAQATLRHLAPGAHYLDLNSVSPGTKRQIAGLVEAAGGRFVEAAIMSPIAPKGAASPMLFGGVHAAGFLPVAMSLGFTGAQLVSGRLGTASAAKMCRSVVIKGLEALLIESLVSARHHGVERAVLESLQGLFPQASWRQTGQYMISRALLHGRRRAEEMREVARTVEEAGLPPRMSRACAEWQAWAAEQTHASSHPELESMLDALLRKTP
jgi:3-hydroxyisobutyrate dehydrogenase-like beta-hydroxyacid dehydrogenase